MTVLDVSATGDDDSRTFDALKWPKTPHVLAYLGHDGLMDFQVTAPKTTGSPLDVYVFACFSQRLFGPLLPKNARFAVSTTGLISPEAYSLDAALLARAEGRDPRAGAADAYNKYQKCGTKGTSSA